MPDDGPRGPASGDAVAATLARLAAHMRAAGAHVGLGELLAAHRALAAVDAASREDAYLALQAAMCSSRSDLAVFAAAFDAVFALPAPELANPLAALGEGAQMALPRISVPDDTPRRVEIDLVPVPAAWSEAELVRHKDFGSLTDAERAATRRLLAQLARRGPMRLSRRTKRTRRRREVHDLRATLRVSMRHGGEFVERRYRAPAARPRRLVLVCDVSGSMAPYARMLLMYLQASVAARARVEAFVFGTRLTRVTRELAGRDPDRALRRAADAVQDWSGGTRIGEAIAELNRVHGRRIGRGALVVVLSDGWDRGDPEQLGEEMARLQRCAHRVVWLNPLAADPRYEPLTRGMQAALPHVDHLIPGNTLASLEALAELMEEGVPA
ncbi:MAG TPA: VWA domain-containing protein [Solirubrobacteraceae bacterium]|nr:VWA domain-containing protein [Solirubrobacteraceae bacterium]